MWTGLLSSEASLVGLLIAVFSLRPHTAFLRCKHMPGLCESKFPGRLDYNPTLIFNLIISWKILSPTKFTFWSLQVRTSARQSGGTIQSITLTVSHSFFIDSWHDCFFHPPSSLHALTCGTNWMHCPADCPTSWICVLLSHKAHLFLLYFLNSCKLTRC